MSGASLTGQDRILSNVIVSWMSHMVFLVAGFILPHQIDSHLGAASLGIWDFGWSLVTYLSLSALGIGSALNRYVASFRAAGDFESLAQVTSTVATVQAGLAAIVFTATLVIMQLIPLFDGIPEANQAEAYWVIFFLGSSLTLQFLFDSSRGVLTGCHRWDIFNALHSLCYFFAISTMLFILWNGGGIEYLAMTYAMMQLTQGILRMVIASRVCPEANFGFRLFRWHFAKELTGFGVKSIVLGATALVCYQTTNILLIQALGPVALAIFARPLALVRQIESLLNRFTFMLTPMAGSIQALQGSGEISKFVIQSGKMAFAVVLPSLVLVAIYGDLLIELWMGADYVNVGVISILTLGLVLPLSQSAIIRILIGLGIHGKAAAISLATFVVVYPTTYFLITPNDVTEFALLAMIPLNIINGIFVPAYCLRALKLHPLSYFFNCFARTAVIVAAVAAVAIYVRYQFGDDLISQFASMVAFGMLIVPLYWQFLLEQPQRRAVLRVVRKLVIQVSEKTGLLTLMLRLFKKRVVILSLHGVCDDDYKGPWRPTWPRMKTSDLKRTLDVLKDYYQFNSLADGVAMLRGERKLVASTMVLTFDDGYRNNLTMAYPIMEQYGAPLNIFIGTGFVGDRRPYFIDRLDYALQNVNESHAEFKGRALSFQIDLAEDALPGSYLGFRRSVRQAYDNDVELHEDYVTFMSELERSSGTELGEVFEDDLWSGLLTKEELHEVAAKGTVGSHTVNHVRLNSVSESRVVEELQQSKQQLESWLGAPCEHFCFPEGRFDDVSVAKVEQVGYLSACTDVVGGNKVGCDMYRLKRISFPIGETRAEIKYRLLMGLIGR